MTKKSKTPEGPDPRRVAATEKSFSGALGQIAKFLRNELKHKDRSYKVLTSNEPAGSLNLSIAQIAKLLRTQLRTQPTPKNTPEDPP